MSPVPCEMPQSSGLLRKERTVPDAPKDRRTQSPFGQPFARAPRPSWPPFGAVKGTVLDSLGTFSYTRGARDAPALQPLPGNYLGPREISVALANRIILSV